MKMNNTGILSYLEATLSGATQFHAEALGVAQNTSFTDWMYGIAKGTYPAYGSVTRAIRQARYNNTNWKKDRTQVAEEVTTTKQEVGYD